MPVVQATRAPPIVSQQSAVLFNRLEGEHAARQLHETIDQFLKRLPPSGGRSVYVGPWIWISNPNRHGKGKDREDRGDSEAFMNRTRRAIEDYDTERKMIEEGPEDKAKGAITRKLTPHRTRLKAELLKIAVEESCLSGKVSSAGVCPKWVYY